MLTKILGSNSQQPAYRHTCIGCVYTQVQFLREKFPSLDIEVDGGVSPTTIDTAAQGQHLLNTSFSSTARMVFLEV